MKEERRRTEDYERELCVKPFLTGSQPPPHLFTTLPMGEELGFLLNMPSLSQVG